MKTLRSNYKAIILIALLVIGLATAVSLAQKQQTVKSKAAVEVKDVIEITDPNGGSVQYDGNTYTTDSNEITITIKK